MIEKFFGWLKGKKYVWYLAGAVVLVIAGILVFKNRNGIMEMITVVHSDFISQVSVSGKVEASEEADLGFAASGRIGKIFARENESVKAGQILAQLEIGDLLADLQIKEINSKTSDIDLEDARENLEKVATQENTKVESAYRKLLSEGLELTPDTAGYTMATPEITGIYNGAEGTYRVRVNRDDTTSTDLDLLTFNLERTQKTINEEGPTSLGTKGLYISFSDDLDLYDDTGWYLEIPNKASSSYLANYNAYNEAKKARDLAVKNAEYEYQKLLAEKNNSLSSVAQAEINKIKSQIKQSTIYAPFDGLVTNVEKEIGETVSANEALVTMMSASIFEIESFIPEVNIALVQTGQEAEVTLDAYGENVPFSAKVVFIDPAETVRDGVSTYKVKLQFSEEDARIKSGMTANVSIMIFSKPNTIVLPGGVVFERNGRKFVQIKNNGKIEDREIVPGDVSSLGQVEVLSGLSDGEKVLLNPNAD